MFRSTYAANDFDVIRAALERMRDEATPRCPLIASQTLHFCLRSASRCNSTCPYEQDWIGPEENV
jgi:hypothetical protein